MLEYTKDDVSLEGLIDMFAKSTTSKYGSRVVVFNKNDEPIYLMTFIKDLLIFLDRVPFKPDVLELLLDGDVHR